MKKILLLLMVSLITMTPLAFSQTNSWPKEINFPKTGGKVIIYQPQPDALEGNKLIGRAAIAGREKPTDELVFGALFFEAKLFTDKATRKGSLESLVITKAKINGIEDQTKIANLTKLLEAEVPKWDLEISLDELVATIKKSHPDAEMFNNDPPKIIYKEKPSTLVILDGEPRIQKDKNLDAERVINSPYLIFKEGTQWNMYVGGVWYQSSSVTEGWTPSKGMSKKVESINTQIKKQEKENNGGKEPTDKPEVTDIIVSTVPAELLQTKGTPVFKSIEGTSLQFVSNTTNDIFKDATGVNYILIAGRWYKSGSMNGPWIFVGSDKMPAEFAKIPEGSEKDNVLVSISGTDAAEEAIIDAEIPQTAKVDRKTATVKVEYDGEPKLEAISGTSLQLVLNSNLTVLKESTGNYFALDNGVWFVSNSAKGPWKVSDKRPSDVDKIPSKSPAYNAKFVHIYETTPDYVIVGYTSGYLGSYVQGDPTIVFGTGFYYQPWYGAIYYPRPATWGFCFSYNPYTGWSMGIGFNIGFLHVGFGFGGAYYGAGWFGPPLYRPPYRPPYYGGGYYGRPGRPGGNYGNNININNSNNINVNVNNNHNNLYRPSQGNNGRPGVVNGGGNNRRPGNSYRPGNSNNEGIGRRNDGNNRSSAGNNVFADKDGNVFQRDQQGKISERDNRSNSWRQADNNAASNIGREAQLRDRGAQRSNNASNFSRPAAARPAGPAAPSRGGAPSPRGGLRRN